MQIQSDILLLYSQSGVIVICSLFNCFGLMNERFGTLVLLCWLDWTGSHFLGASEAVRLHSTSGAAVGSAEEAAGARGVTTEDGDVAGGGRC